MTGKEAVEILDRDDSSMRKGYFCINDFLAIEKLKEIVRQESKIGRMTNGNMIMTMFPTTKIRDGGNFISFTLDGIVGTTVEKSWWNAPYKAESEG